MYKRTRFWSLILTCCCYSAMLCTAYGKPLTTRVAESDVLYLQHINKTCLSRDCNENVNLEHMHNLSTHMDRFINPCDDFHAYACTNWKREHPNVSTTMALGEELLTEKYLKIFNAHEHQQRLENDVMYGKLQQYYQQCIQSENNGKLTWMGYILQLRKMGLLQAPSPGYHWLTTYAELLRFAKNEFFIALEIGMVNSSQFMLNIYPHQQQKTVEFSEEIYMILQQYTNDSYQYLQREFKKLELDLQNILNSACANANMTDDECDLSDYIAYKDLLKSNSTLPWAKLLRSYPLEMNDLLLVNDLQSINKIHQYLDAADQKILFLYSISRFVNYLQSHKHNIVVKGAQPYFCVRHMRKLFHVPMNYLYEKVYYGQHRMQSDMVILSMFDKLKQQFALNLLSNQMQLGAKSLEFLQNKLQYLELNIGNLPKNVTQDFYDSYLEYVDFTSNYYANHLAALKHFYVTLNKLSSPNKFSQLWFTFNLHRPNFLDNLDSTAYYLVSCNLIVLPYAYLQLPFYDHRLWPSLLYGDLANTLGHELIHAFDNDFINYDYAGNYDEDIPPQILQNSHYKSNLKCLQKKYTNFLTERIADLSGTRLALKTFAKDPLFLKYNGKLFFLQFAQFFCGSSTDSVAHAKEDSTHDMDSIRLNYTLAHMPEFAEVFNCPLGSPMNPVEKCHLW